MYRSSWIVNPSSSVPSNPAAVHARRHTFRKFVKDADAYLEDAQFLMRHRDSRHTAETYDHTGPGDRRILEVVESLPKLSLRRPIGWYDRDTISEEDGGAATIPPPNTGSGGEDGARREPTSNKAEDEPLSEGVEKIGAYETHGETVLMANSGHGEDNGGGGGNRTRVP